MNFPSNIFPFAYLNGAVVPVERALVSPLDRGFLMGDGLFETLHVFAGAPLDLEPHLSRLDDSCDFFGLALPTRAELPKIFGRVIASNGLVGDDAPEAALRLTVSRGVSPSGPPTVLVHLRSLDPGHLSKREVGVHLHELPLGGRGAADLVQHKSSSYAASALSDVWLRSRPDHKATDEGLFVSHDGEVREGASCNVFAISGRRMITPPVSCGILPGILRAAVCAMGSELGYEVAEATLTLDALLAADEAFVTSSTLHAAPVVAVGDRRIGTGGPGPQVLRLQASLMERAQRQVAQWRNRSL
ncbi:MAG: hypothetical protein CL940_05985 [Deltaproteobacteria bacterium]|nr:hypothetical protein [Deltaproteobacteria bacterium]